MTKTFRALVRYLQELDVFTQYPVVQSDFEINKPGMLQELFLSQRPQGTQRRNI